jgi:hypothetical protein
MLIFQYGKELKVLHKQLKMVPSSANSSKRSATAASCQMYWPFTRLFERSAQAALTKLLQMAAACYTYLTVHFRKRETVSCWKKHLLRVSHTLGQIQSCGIIFLATTLMKMSNALGRDISRGLFHLRQELGRLRFEPCARKRIIIIKVFLQFE